MVIGGCCSSACSTALGTVDVMGCGLLARVGPGYGWGGTRGSGERPVELRAAVAQIRVGCAGGGQELGVGVGADEFLGAAGAGAGDAVGPGEHGQAGELQVPFRADAVGVGDV